jgi:acyl-CoA reductase-like NAD-dependent aldehyde dehydrogenase
LEPILGLRLGPPADGPSNPGTVRGVAERDRGADLAGTFEWERPVKPDRGGFGLVVKEPAGVVGAIIP